MTFNRFMCKLGLHIWRYHQEIFVTHTNFEDEHNVVIGWKNCIHCFKSKLVHILK